MYTLIIIVFILGYLAIALEGPLKINKSAIALLTGVLCWVFYIFSNNNKELVSQQLYDHFGEIGSILFFLLAAMTIVEIIDAHDGFEVIKRTITTKNKRRLLWIVGILTFFLSAVLDNLTTAIVMVSLVRKLIIDKQTRMYFMGLVIIAANAGGAWSPIGDVTTTMLWIGGQITAGNIMIMLIIPSIVCLLVPVLILSFQIKGKIEGPEILKQNDTYRTTLFEQKLILSLGIGVLIFVPVFKSVTDLPPFMGILFGLGLLWMVTEIIHKKKDAQEKDAFSVVYAIRKVDVPSVLFFLGILLAISALESTHQLASMANFMNNKIGNTNVIVILVGLLSAIVDNVPLVAATTGMYNLQDFPTDHYLWEFIAYCAGTGGSCLIIGSAAGVAVMGMENIDFLWYLKRISWLALIGYFAGALVYMGQHYLL